ncbi:MAG: NAD(+)/NADH kinase [Clostridiales bacterium]|nr:NAD(+)/NADH kinase [Clostridiales bacterium]
MKIGLYANTDKDPNGEVCRAVKAAAQKNGVSVADYKPGEFFDFIVSIGGDGTILRVAQESAKSGIPILGVNRGTVGFLTEIEPEGLEEAISKLIKRDYVLERRALLDVIVRGEHYHALNDAVVMRTNGGRVIGMEIGVNGEHALSITCDGYIASTPTGSTAYSLSAGGAIIAPSAAVIELTPVNPHALHARSMVVNSGADVTMKYSSGAGASLFIDGETVLQLKEGDTVSVTGWDLSALFVRLKQKSFYSRLTDKLNI